MRSDSELMNELAHKADYLYEMTAEESEMMKSVLLDIYRDFARLCRENNLIQMLGGGSCLGAIRHKDFIPWDDDLDVMMPRKDYDRLIELLEDGEMSEKYEFSYPDGKKDSKNAFLKIYRKGSLNVELFCEGTPFPQGIYLDVFPMEFVPDSRLGQLINGFFANILLFISIMVLYAQYPTNSLRRFMTLDKSLKRRYNIKRAIGTIFGIIPHYKWVYWFDRFVASSKPTNKVGIPTGRKRYNGEIYDTSAVFPPAEASLREETVYVPADYDSYLKNLYRNYMELPPIEKRERHFIIKFQPPCDR